MGEDAARQLQSAIRRSFAENGNESDAAAMQSYMKSEMPFYGIKSSPRQKLVKEAGAAVRLPDRPTYERAVHRLFFEAERREERYAAIDVTTLRYYHHYQDPAHIPLYEEMAVGGAWWDIVDYIAPRRLGPILKKYPEETKPVMRKWANDQNIWRRRCAMLSQLKFKADTDTGLLMDCIRPSLGSNEFFLNKAIGWVLREYAKTDAAFVIDFVSEHADRLHPLSKREALRRLKAAGRVDEISRALFTRTG